MDLANFVIGWFYYSFYYMLFSVFATLMLNRFTKRLWLSPLIINAVSIVLLILIVKNNWIAGGDATYAMYFNYMPIVFASIVLNLSIGIKNQLMKTNKHFEEV